GGEDSKYIFTTNGTKPISGFSNFKNKFDRRLSQALQNEGDTTRNRIIAALNERYPGKNYQPFDDKWTTHSLPKTTRTLLSRVRIDRDTAEKCLGHVEGGIVGTYNRHEAKPEKRTAFEALAREIERIVSKGSKDNVVPLSRA